MAQTSSLPIPTGNAPDDTVVEPDVDAAPQRATAPLTAALILPLATQTMTVSGVALAERPARDVGPGCVGQIGNQAGHSFELLQPRDLAFEVTRASDDMTMTIVGPQGVMCDDDGGVDLLPRIQGTLPAGRYEVFIGTYGGSAGPVPYSLSIGQPPPPADPAACDTTRTITLNEGFSNLQMRIEHPGGDAACTAAYGVGCPGYFVREAGPCVVVEERTRVVVDVVTATFDTVLVMHGASLPLTHFNDDGPVDTRSQLIATLEPGNYALRIGSYLANESGAVTLGIRNPDNPQASDAPVVCSALARGESVEFTGFAVGADACTDALGRPCYGYISQSPSQCIDLSVGTAVTVEVIEATFDSTLSLRGDRMFLTNDDTDSTFNAALTHYLHRGTYDIFVGSYLPSTSGTYSLRVSAR